MKARLLAGYRARRRYLALIHIVVAVRGGEGTASSFKDEFVCFVIPGP